MSCSLEPLGYKKKINIRMTLTADFNINDQKNFYFIFPLNWVAHFQGAQFLVLSPFK